MLQTEPIATLKSKSIYGISQGIVAGKEDAQYVSIYYTVATYITILYILSTNHSACVCQWNWRSIHADLTNQLKYAKVHSVQ